MKRQVLFRPATVMEARRRALAIAVACMAAAMPVPAGAEEAWLSSPDANRAAPAAEALTGTWRGEMETPEGRAALILRIETPDNGYIQARAETSVWDAPRTFTVRIDGRSLSLLPIPPDNGAPRSDQVEMHLGLSHGDSRLAGAWLQTTAGAGGRVELMREGGAAVPEPEPVASVAPLASIAGDASGPASVDDARLTVRAPARTRVGEEVTVWVEALNAADVSRIGTLAVSVYGPRCGIPVNKSAYDLLLPGTQARMATFVKDGAVWRVRPRQEQVSPSVPHVEVFTRDWRAHGRKELRFPIRFESAGTARLLIRATFCGVAAGPGVVEENLPPGGPQDEQGLPCMVWTIEVE